jgi:hypothetical protein
MTKQDKNNQCDDCNVRIAPKKSNNWVKAVKAVFWSFLGVRKRKDLEDDMQHLNMATVAVTGVAGMLVFILILLLVVHLVVAK